MRPIKFRIWNGETMVSPDYIDREGYAHWKENSIPQSSNEVMQYIGLEDKNGVEIYEGDFILWPDGFVQEVKLDYDFELIDMTDEWCYGFKVHNYIDATHNVKVIGNIWESPESSSNVGTLGTSSNGIPDTWLSSA